MYTQHRSHFSEQRATVSCGSPTKFANDSRNEPAAPPHHAFSIRYKRKPAQSLNSFKTKASGNFCPIQISPFRPFAVSYLLCPSHRVGPLVAASHLTTDRPPHSVSSLITRHSSLRF